MNKLKITTDVISGKTVGALCYAASHRKLKGKRDLGAKNRVAYATIAYGEILSTSISYDAEKGSLWLQKRR